MNLILLGAPGSGKGAQASLLIKEYKLAHVSTGNILRKEVVDRTDVGIEAKSYMEKGLLVPEELIIRIVGKELSSPACANGFILDGVPRTIFQAECLDEILQKQNRKIDRVICLEVAEETLVKRLTNRRTCVKCSRVYNLIGQPPRIVGKCDECGSDLIQRSDDNEETVRKRFIEYDQNTKPLLDFYQKKGILLSLNGEQPLEDVFKEIQSDLGISG